MQKIFINGTFKICLVGYYQVLYIGGLYSEINGIIPLFLIPTIGKSEYLDNLIFSDIKKILEDAGINIEDIPKYFMIDFEVALQNSIKKILLIV